MSTFAFNANAPEFVPATTTPQQSTALRQGQQHNSQAQAHWQQQQHYQSFGAGNQVNLFQSNSQNTNNTNNTNQNFTNMNNYNNMINTNNIHTNVGNMSHLSSMNPMIKIEAITITLIKIEAITITLNCDYRNYI